MILNKVTQYKYVYRKDKNVIKRDKNKKRIK